MASLVVVYDRDKEMAAIVDTDARMGWGPAMVGPDAGDILETFVASVPFDITLLGAVEATAAFQGWLEGLVAAASQTAATPDTSPLEPPSDPAVDEPPISESWGTTGSEDAPEPQPADTDMGADPGPPPTVIDCPLCGATGVTQDGEDGATQTCAMCQGAKVVRMGAPA